MQKLRVAHVSVAAERPVKAVRAHIYGDCSGQLEDPFGHLWWVATHKEDASPEEMQKRVEAMFAAKKEIRIWNFFRPRVDSG